MIPTLVAGFLVFSRLAGMVMTMPVLSSPGIPATLRLLVALPLSVVLTPGALAAREIALPLTVPNLVLAIGAEALLGAAMGALLSVACGTLTAASEVAAAKMGLSIGGLLDPLVGTMSTSLGRLASVLAGAAFLATDAHHAAIIALGRSLATLPIGACASTAPAAPVLAGAVASAAIVALQLAGPVVAFVMLVNATLLLVGRMAPNLQLFFSVGTSATVAAGLAVFAVALPGMLGVLAAELAAVPSAIGVLVAAVARGG
jgi:flagellar biosynthetic protein FliR